MNRTKIIIILGIGIVVLTVISVILSIIRPQTPQDQTVQQRDGQIVVTQPPTNEETSQQFRILQFIPEENAQELHFPILQIEVVFSDTVNPETIQYSVDPPTQTYLKAQGNRLIISPETTWQNGVATLTILQTSQSPAGEQLDQSYTYRFQTGPPPLPDDVFEE